jgi:hypothetical protein
MQDIHQRQQGTTKTHEDNEGAGKLANNPMASNETKHIDINSSCTNTFESWWMQGHSRLRQWARQT